MPPKPESPTFQDIVARLNEFWAGKGCLIQHGYDLEVGAATFNPQTFLRALDNSKTHYKSAYVEHCRRPQDGRYGQNPNRLQKYFQYQVVMKPAPADIQSLYLQSLGALGIDRKEQDIRFVHDDWESPTLVAWGLGWEVCLNGMEVSQFTYFQQVGGVAIDPIMVEITYGLERLAMGLQKVDSVFEVRYNDEVRYGDLYLRNEEEFSTYTFELAPTKTYAEHFDFYRGEAERCLSASPKPLFLVACDMIMKCSHLFNVMEARGDLSLLQRRQYVDSIRGLSHRLALAYQETKTP